MLVLAVVDPVGTLRGFEPVGTRLARLLVDVFGVARHRRHGAWRSAGAAWWTTKEEALADAALVSGAMPPKVYTKRKNNK